MDADSKIFIMHIIIREQKKMSIHLEKQVQINAQNEAQVGTLLFDEALTTVPAEYSDYSKIFLVKNVMELSQYTGINYHTIKLEEDK